MPSPRGVCRFRGPAFSARGPESIGWTGALLTGFLLVVPTLGIAGAAYARPAQVMGAPSPGSTSHPLPPGPPPLLNGTTVLDSAAVENDPSSATWDPANGYLYVTNFGAILLGGNTVSVVNGATDTSLATLPVGDDPISSVYDPADGYVYVMNYGTTDNVSVLSGTSVIGAIAVGSNPSGGIYDPSDGNVYVWNTKSANISVINGTSVVATINVGIDPASGAYDASRGYVYVANAASNNVSILQGNAVLATVNVGIQPESTVYDSATQCIYIVNTGSNNVTLLNGTQVVGWASAGGTPTFAGYDPRDDYVYVSDDLTNSVLVLHGASIVANVSVNVDPRAAVYDASNGMVYVPSWTDNVLDVFNGTFLVATVGVGVSPIAATYDPGNDGLYSVNFNTANLTHVGTPTNGFPATFTETGLPPGTAWALGLGPARYAVRGASLALALVNGSYTFSTPPLAGFQSVNATGNLSITGAASAVTILFERTYPIAFVEVGLLAGDVWNVSIGPYDNISSAGELDLWEPNGTFTYSVAPVPGFVANWTGDVTVDGAGTMVNVVFSRVFYNVVFLESGLPVGTQWSATVGSITNQSTTTSDRIPEPNGSYSYQIPDLPGFVQSPASGSVYVRGHDTPINIRFTPIYTVTFAEDGLPAGTNWTVRIGAHSVTSDHPTIQFQRTDGRYTYVVNTSDSRFAPNATIGNVTINGAPASVIVLFEPTTPPRLYPVLFHQTGAPLGTAWTVRLTAHLSYYNMSTGAVLGFEVPNGTYAFSVTSNGYLADPPTGNLTVNGSLGGTPNIEIQLALRPHGPPKFSLTFAQAGLALGVPWSIVLGNRTFPSNGAASVVLSEPNGTYAYTVRGVPGYRWVTPGTVTVVGNSPVVPVTFSVRTYAVTFEESGLASGSLWNLSAGGVANSSIGTQLVLWLANGTYMVVVAPIPGYELAPTDIVVIAGSSPAAVPLVFTRAITATAPWLGLSTGDAEALFGLLGLEIVVAVALLAGRRRRPPREMTEVGLGPEEGPPGELLHGELPPLGPGG